MDKLSASSLEAVSSPLAMRRQAEPGMSSSWTVPPNETASAAASDQDQAVQASSSLPEGSTWSPTDDEQAMSIPKYLQETYWWAYVHPNAVRFFERQWLVNLILWGNFSKLRDRALDEVGDSLPGATLQIACVYGDFTPQVAARLVDDEARLDVVDIAPEQLKNVHGKVDKFHNVFLHRQDSTALEFADASFDNVVVFFLLHEQPLDVRKKTVREALRVTKPGGRVIFVDYHKPTWLSPFRYIMIPILTTLEPFAMDLWRHEITEWIPAELQPAKIEKETYFGGLYQKVVMTR